MDFLFMDLNRPKFTNFSDTYGYKFVFTFEEYETEDTTLITGIIKDAKKKDVGRLEAYYIFRRSWRSNFYTDCDSVSAELQLLSNVLFYVTGKLRKYEWDDVFNGQEIEKCSFKGFLNIAEVSVNEEHRGKDLAFSFLKSLFQKLQTQFTLSVVVPGYVSRNGLRPDVAEQKHNNICKLFSRLGFKAIPKYPKYWYLLPQNLEFKTKSDVKDLVVLRSNKEVEPLQEVVEFINAFESILENQYLLRKKVQELKNENLLLMAEALHTICANEGMTKLVKALVMEGVDVNTKNKIGDTALHACCRLGGKECLQKVEFLLNNGADPSQLNADSFTPYDIIISKINDISCCYLGFNLKPKFENVMCNYDVAKLLMPLSLRNNFLHGVISQRMFERLFITVEVQNDTSRLGFNDISRQYPSRKPIDTVAVSRVILLFDSIPKEITDGGVYKSFVAGFCDILRNVYFILKRGNLPTVSKVMQGLRKNRPPNHKFYFTHGGKIDYVYKAIFSLMRDSCWAYGDGNFEETFKDDLEALPAVHGFDDDFQYLDIIFYKYLIDN